MTCGHKGSILVPRQGDPVHSPACTFTQQVVDTVGAGDAFTAALTLGLLQKKSLADIATLANEV